MPPPTAERPNRAFEGLEGDQRERWGQSGRVQLP